MKLTEGDKQQLGNLTVLVILDARRQALRKGSNPLKLWDQLQARMLAAARTTASASEWSTRLFRSLQIEAPDKDSSRSISELVGATQGRAPAWLDLVERESGYLMALARLEAERRKDAAQIVAAGEEN